MIYDLYYACSGKNVQKVRKICADPRQKHQLNYRGNRNKTPLYCAVRHHQLEMVKILLNHPDMQAKDDDGRTALAYACRDRFASLEMIELLIAKDPNGVHSVNNMQSSILQCSFQPRRLDIVRCLIKHGADPNYKNSNGEHALFFAVSHRDFDAATVNFLMQETNCNIKHRNNDGKTAYELISPYYFKSSDYDKNERCIAEMFGKTYDEIQTPATIGQLFQGFSSFRYSRYEMKNVKEFDGVKMAMVETFYKSSSLNPEHYEFVTQLLAVDLHSNQYNAVNEKIRLCLPFHSKNVLDQCPAHFSDHVVKLDTLFRLFLYGRELFDKYLLKITSLEEPYSSFFKIGTESKNDRLLEFFKILCWHGMNLEKILFRNVELRAILYPLLPFVRPFLQSPTAQDAVICRHFQETDSNEDVHGYLTFKREFEKGLKFGSVPTLFNLSRTVIRHTVFIAANLSKKKLFNLQTLDVPKTIKNRLFYLHPLF